jgi:hypothetical protein
MSIEKNVAMSKSGSSMLVEVSGQCGTALNTLRPKRLPIHIGSAGERARPPVQSVFVPDQMNRTEPKRLWLWWLSWMQAAIVVVVVVRFYVVL